MDSLCERVDLKQEHVDTVRILDACPTLFELQANRIERNQNYLVQQLKNWMGHEVKETPGMSCVNYVERSFVPNLQSKIFTKKDSGIMNQTPIDWCEMRLEP